MKHGGRRQGAGRPKQRTVLEVALSLSAPAEWEATVPVTSAFGGGDGERVSAKYRPSAESVLRSSIPAAAVRRQEIEINAGKPRRSLCEIEWELVERYNASTANDTTVGGRRVLHEPVCEEIGLDEIDDAFIHGDLHSEFSPRAAKDAGSSISDFLTERFYDGTMQPTELRGLKWVR